jgi:putative tryptophan/tyrosine transport system permease protein
MNLWIGAVALGLAFAAAAIGVYMTFRVLAFPDLTVDGSFPLGAAVASILIVRGWDPWLAMLAAVAAGALAGMATALLNSRFRINGLLAGILVSIGLWTINLRVMDEKSNVPLLSVDNILTPVRPFIADPNIRAVAVFAAVVIVLGLALNWLLHTDLGLALRASGDNEKMVRAQGVDADRMRLLGLAISNGFVALSGSMVAQYQGYADVTMGLGLIVAGLASVIIGETIFRPRGVLMTIGAAIVGSVLYRLVIAAALFVGLGPTDMRLVTSVIVILALSVPQLRGALGLRGLSIGTARA